MADGAGEYVGRAVEINGKGYAGMTFSVKSGSSKDFENWIAHVKESSSHLTKDVYDEEDLYHKIVNKYMYPTKRVL